MSFFLVIIFGLLVVT